MKFSLAMPALAALLLVAACDTNVVEPDPIDNDPGGTTDVSFSSDVLPILTSSCGGSGCHAPGTQSGVGLSSYIAVTTSVGSQYGTKIVVPGNAAASPLVEKIAGTIRFGARMPLGRPTLSSAQVTTIRNWVNEGAKNN